MLVRNGMRTVQLIGVPEPGLAVPEADAVVVALKSRTAPVAEAVADSLAAQRWLAGQGARQYLFKYCSTFDSTDAGNIGPVADALLDALEQRLHHRLPRLPRDRPHHLQGPPLRRRPAALRHPHAPPPADAHDRRQPGPRDGPPDPPQGRPRPSRHRPPRPRGDPCPLRRAPRRRHRLRRHRRGRGRGPAPPRHRQRRPGADHRRLRHRHGPARELPAPGPPPRRPRRRHASPRPRLRGRARRLLLRRDPGPGRRHGRPAPRTRASTRPSSPPAGTPPPPSPGPHRTSPRAPS